jgi:signal transduction histidine kinase
LARSLQIPVHEIVANHADSLFTCLPADAQASDYKAATEFLRTLCEVAAAAAATEREQFLRKLAHALRTPLTTLRLSLQVGVGRVERGEPLTAATLQKSIAQIDKIAAQIAEIFKDFQPRPRSPDQPRP